LQPASWSCFSADCRLKSPGSTGERELSGDGRAGQRSPFEHLGRILIALSQKVNLSAIRKWSAAEKSMGRFEELERELKDARRKKKP
jgi:hypothetical protein